MKKCWICLTTLLLMLLLIPSVAMAEKETSFYCFSCCAERTGIISDTYEYSDVQYHIQRIICKTCSYRGVPIASPHTESRAATCQSAAYCNVCQSYYGDPLQHNWGSWEKFNENQHYRTCQNSGCSQTEYRGHTGGNATCTQSATCEICSALYIDENAHSWGGWVDNGNGTHSQICQHNSAHKSSAVSHAFGTATCTTPATCSECNSTTGSVDPDNHTGTATTSYEKISDTQHRENTTYSCCSATVYGTPVSHTETTSATCTAAAYCGVCKSSYGSTNPENHTGPLTTTYEKVSDDKHKVMVTCGGCGKTSSEYTEGHNWSGWNSNDYYHSHSCSCGATVTAPHTSDPQATCVTPQLCSACQTSYLSTSNHEGTFHTTYELYDAYEYLHVMTETCDSCKRTRKTSIESHQVDSDSTCTQAAHCALCNSYFGGLSLGHDLVTHEAKAPTCTETGWEEYETCKNCDYTTYKELPALGHDLMNHDAKAPTCTETGWKEYETCKNCDYSTYKELPALGHSYTTETKKPTCTAPGTTTTVCTRCKKSSTEQTAPILSHWYGEWKQDSHGTNGTHTASCLRYCGHRLTVPCTLISYTRVLADGQTEKLELCPICGQVSDGSQLALVKDAKAAALTKELPAGEVALRMGELENGEIIMSVAFEISGALTQPTGKVKITLPAALLDGYALFLVDEEGNETALEPDIQKKEASFRLDFTPDPEEDAPAPTAIIRLVP